MMAQLMAAGGGLVAEVECAPGTPQVMYGTRLFRLVGNQYVEFVGAGQPVAVPLSGFLGGIRSEDPSIPLAPGLRLPASGF